MNRSCKLLIMLLAFTLVFSLAGVVAAEELDPDQVLIAVVDMEEAQEVGSREELQETANELGYTHVVHSGNLEAFLDGRIDTLANLAFEDMDTTTEMADGAAKLADSLDELLDMAGFEDITEDVMDELK